MRRHFIVMELHWMTDEPTTTVTTDEPHTTTTSCCDPALATNHVCREGCACCPDGNWVGSIGDAATFYCDGVAWNIVNDSDEFGAICGDAETTEPHQIPSKVNQYDIIIGIVFGIAVLSGMQ
eukprot:1040513_1